MQSNLAFVLDPVESIDSTEPAVLDAAALDEMLRLGAARISSPSRTHVARKRRTLASFRDNHAKVCEPFRIY